jgi:catechol 2,3-dioxygenase-like lactoylglutathione lyase family enzyme
LRRANGGMRRGAIMPISGMNHCTVLTDDVAATVGFYRDLLGLVDGPRPGFGFPGAWLYAGGEAVLHVVGGRPRSELRAGVIDHVAFSATGLAATLAALDARGIAHDCRQLPGGGAWQVFFHDPNGAKIELDFAPGESPSR